MTPEAIAALGLELRELLPAISGLGAGTIVGAIVFAMAWRDSWPWPHGRRGTTVEELRAQIEKKEKT